MAQIEQPTLWVVNKISLANEAIEKACQFFNFKRKEIGFIGDGKFEIGKRLTIGIVNTLFRRSLDELRDKFGLILVDEAHHFPAEMFYRTLNQFPAKYRYWCTATPKRQDGLTKMLYYGGGPILHTVERHELPTITPDVKVIKTSFDQVIDNHTKTLKALVQDENRNQLIVDTISREVTTGNYHLVLSQRIDHLELLQELLASFHPHLSIELFHSKLKNCDEIMKRAKNKEIDILLATSQIAQEGLDIPHLNRLYLVTPKKAVGTVEQELGRIMRPSEYKKDAVVYDFWDHQCPMVRKQFWNRRSVYQKLNMRMSYLN
jgi:superfamily II DNA or RNA helicase